MRNEAVTESSGVHETRRRALAALLTATAVLTAAAWGGSPLFAQEAGPVAPAVPAGDGLTLAEAVRMVLERSPRIETARHALEEAEERVSEAWGGVMPSLDFSADYTRNVSPAVNFLPAIIFDPQASPDEQVAVQFGADNLWQSIFTLEQPLFDGQAFVGVGASGRYLAYQEEVLRGEVHTAVARVRSAYYGALLADEQFRLTGNSVARVREALAETQALGRAGLASEYDVLRLEVELANLEPNLLRAENALRRARRDLAAELDLNADSLVLEGSLATLVLDDPAANSTANQALLALAGTEPQGGDREGLVADALAARSDVRQLELTEELRNAELRAEQAEYLPRVSLFGNYGISASQNGGPDFFGEPRAYSRRVGVQVSLPIFNGFARESRVDQRRAGLRGAQVRTRFARVQATNEVRGLLEEVSEARDRAVAQRRAVGQAERGFDIARAEFREGLGSRLDVTDAEVALRESEFNYAQAVFDYLSARARLDVATGALPAEVGAVELN